MKFLGLIAIGASIFMASNSYALIEGQVLVGQRSASLSRTGTSWDMKGSETKLSVYVDPIPLVPVGFGLSFSNVDLGDYTDYSISGLKGTEISLDVTAWLPLGIAGLKPYAKLAYVMSGEYSLSQTGSADQTLDSGGTKISAGIKYSPLPLIALLLELEKSNITLKPSNGDDSKSDNMSIFLGLAVGI